MDAAVAGPYLALVLLALAARIPILESTIGHARLIAVHRTLGPWTVWLILIHVALVVPYQALTLGTNWINQAWSMLTTQVWIVAALAGLALFVAVGLTSWRRIRGRLPRDLWWIGLYVAVASSLMIWRVAVPTIRSWRADTRVAAVIDESPGFSSVWITGKGLGTWGAEPGQFVTAHFWERRLFFEGHPYSLSAPIVNDSMRIIVKAVGAASTTTQHLQPGTRAWIEGPYGVMTPERALTKRAVLVGGGIGIAPMIALAYDLAQRSDVDVIIRVHSREELAFRDDLERLYRTPRVNIHLLVGSRAQYPLDAQHLHGLVPHVGASDLYVCGPQSFMDSIATSAQSKATPSASATPSPSESASTSSNPTSTTEVSASADAAEPVTFTGDTYQSPYGPMQVQVTVVAGAITDIHGVQLPQDRHSEQINSFAAPHLIQEALAAQSAQVDSVSGASYTSAGFAQSLQSALDQAGV